MRPPQSETPAAVAPRRPDGRITLRQFLRLLRENALATYSADDFSADVIAHRLLWRRSFVVNDPDAIRHVLVDNAGNYTKSEL